MHELYIKKTELLCVRMNVYIYGYMLHFAMGNMNKTNSLKCLLNPCAMSDIMFIYQTCWETRGGMNEVEIFFYVMK